MTELLSICVYSSFHFGHYGPHVEFDCINAFYFISKNNAVTVDSRYLDFGYLEQPLISKKKSGPCLNIEI